jgi:hypothetical protein
MKSSGGSIVSGVNKVQVDMHGTIPHSLASPFPHIVSNRLINGLLDLKDESLTGLHIFHFLLNGMQAALTKNVR